ncbi:Vacuolar protein-sorting-associated protein 36 [Microbotryomycetes sp. JL221]|nr:Vacuolar protein-sorting-associated protein 36 [Microbotryomycetes sp. JL221]
MHRFVPIDASHLTLSAQLYPDEHVILSQDGVGLYDGKDKAPEYFEGRLYLTSHRLVYLNQTNSRRSVALSLDTVKQTEYWTGFLKSSPKITLLLSSSSSSLSALTPTTKTGTTSTTSSLNSSTTALTNLTTALSTAEQANNALASTRTWTCRVCGMRNTPSTTLGNKCSLCGVARDKASTTAAPTSTSRGSGTTIPRSSTPRMDRDPYGRIGTPPPLPPPLPPPPSTVTAASGVREQTSVPVTATETRVTCPVCTFLNHHSMSACEMCETPLYPNGRPRSTTAPTPAAPSEFESASRSTTPGLERFTTGASTPTSTSSEPSFVRLSFRKGGEKAFYTSLKDALAKKAWDLDSSKPTTKTRKGTGDVSADNIARQGTPSAGIDAILKGIDLDTRDRDDTMEDAFKDLDALMSKAKDMASNVSCLIHISLAKSINERLSSSTTSTATTSADSTTEAKAAASSLASVSLARIGLVDAPITADMVSDERAYHQELAKELGQLLCRRRRNGQGQQDHEFGLLQQGVMGLDQVWCLWNRARGVALVPPSSLRSCAPYLPQYTNPQISIMTFESSGLTILHTSQYSVQQFSARLMESLDIKRAMSLSLNDNVVEDEDNGTLEPETKIERQGMTLLDIARREKEFSASNDSGGGGGGLAIQLIKEYVDQVELTRGDICRDEQGGAQGVRWFRNFLSNPNWQSEWDGTRLD